MYEEDINELRHLINIIDRDVVVDKLPQLNILKQIIKLIDDMDFEYTHDLEEKCEDYKERLESIQYGHVESLANIIYELNKISDTMKKWEQAMVILGLLPESKLGNFKNLLEDLDDVHYCIESQSEI